MPIESQYEVIRAILFEDSPCCGVHLRVDLPGEVAVRRHGKLREHNWLLQVASTLRMMTRQLDRETVAY